MKFATIRFFFLSLFALTSANQAFSMEAVPNCASALSDSDGDGYGWENSQSCVVVADAGSCEDRGEYPWGWNPVTETSCRLDNTINQSTVTVETTANCEDHGGYPWGWNPTTETSCRLDDGTDNHLTDNSTLTSEQAGVCVDSDADGYGWNGTTTCDPDASTVATPSIGIGNETEQQNAGCINSDDIGTGRDGLAECQIAVSPDPAWSFCEFDSYKTVVLEHGQTWGTETGGQDTREYSCVRRCGTAAIDLPNTPGWSYDPDADAECIVDNTTAQLRVPVYDVQSTTVERQSFEHHFAYPLFAGNTSWQCKQETRNSNSEEFIHNGFSRSITFDTSHQDRNWYFHWGQWRSLLIIDDNSIEEDPFEYVGFAQITHDNLVVYRNTLDRLSCESNGNPTDTTLPITTREFHNAANLPLTDLLDRSFQCQVLENLTRSQNSPSGVGWSSNSSDDNSGNQSVTFTPTFIQYNDAGERLYQLSADSRLYQSDGFRFYTRQNGTSSYYWQFQAKEIGNNIIFKSYSGYATSGGGTDRQILYACPINQ